MQDEARLFGVVLLRRHQHRLVAAQLAALADEREQTTGRAESSASVGVEGLPQLAMHDVAFRGSVLYLEGQGDHRRTPEVARRLRPANRAEGEAAIRNE